MKEELLAFAMAKREHACIRNFCSNVSFPTHEECCAVLRDDIVLLAEYGDWNHALLKSLYEASFGSEKLVKKVGELILDRGGPQALWASGHAINRIMAHLLKAADPRLLDADNHLLEEADVQSRLGAPSHNWISSPALFDINRARLEPIWRKLIWREERSRALRRRVFVRGGGRGRRENFRPENLQKAYMDRRDRIALYPLIKKFEYKHLSGLIPFQM